MRLILLLTLTFVITANSAWCQNPQSENPNQKNSEEPRPVKGTITEIKEAGKNKLLVITNEEGKTMEVPLGRIAIDIKGKGDEGFIRPGTFIGAEGVLTNDMLFVKEINVLLPQPRQKLPRGMVKKAPRRVGISQNTYQIMGTIQGVKPNPLDEKYKMIAINAAGKYPPINLEQNVSITVVTTNLDLLEEGMAVDLEGRMFRGKPQVTKITANRDAPFNSAEIFPAAEGEGERPTEEGSK